MNPIFFILGIVDIAVALLIFFPLSETIVLYAMVYMIAKGGYVMLHSIIGKNFSPIFIVLASIDLMTGIVLGLISLGTSMEIFWTLGIVSISKGLYSTATTFF